MPKAPSNLPERGTFCSMRGQPEVVGVLRKMDDETLWATWEKPDGRRKLVHLWELERRFMKTISLDPERITSRLFGGPFFASGWTDGRYLYNRDRSKKWAQADIERGWMEGFNPDPV